MDEPIVNTFVPDLDKLTKTITERCADLTTRQREISSRTNFAFAAACPEADLIPGLTAALMRRRI